MSPRLRSPGETALPYRGAPDPWRIQLRHGLRTGVADVAKTSLSLASWLSLTVVLRILSGSCYVMGCARV
jgi:hypothetical protein